MPEIKGINTDSASLGGDLPDSYLNRDMPWRKQERKSVQSFRKGEIIHGEITEIISKTEAFVRLPSGVLRALVAGNLKKGDSLYFQVQETEPYLILKIFSTSLKKDGEDIPEEELVRILDLPDDDFFKSIITFYREKKSVITRDDVFKIEKASSKITGEPLSGLTMNDLFNIVYLMEENKIQHTAANFLKLKHAFKSPGFIHEKMLELEKQIDAYPRLSSAYQPFFDTVRQSGKQPADSMKLLNGIGRAPSILSGILGQIGEFSRAGQPDEPLNENLEFFKKLMESAEFLRKSSENAFNSYFLFFPINISMFFTIARFTVRKQRPGAPKSAKPGIKPMDIMNAIIQTDSFMEDKKTIKHGLFSQSEKACRMLAGLVNSQISGLLIMGIETQSLLISNFPDDDFELNIRNQSGQMKNFTIVV